DITKCSQLQTLVLNEIDSQSLENLLIGLTSLNNLSSLSIHVGRDSNKITIYNLIFHLSILKHCKISFEENVPLEYLPMSKSPSSSIEHLIINDNYNLNEVEAILSYVPHIRRLSIEYQHRPYPQAALIFLTVLNNLTHVCVTGDRLTNVGIEQFIKKYFRQIKVLHISANRSLSCSGTWLKPILSYLPHVHVFDFADANMRLCGRAVKVYRSIYDPHYLSFSDVRQWFFTHEPMSDESLHKLFCSIQPHKANYFVLTRESNFNTYTCHVEAALDSVHHVIIPDEYTSINCLKYFPKATEVTVCNYSSIDSNWFANNKIQCSIPLAQLTNLTINTYSIHLHVIVDMLQFTPNIHTLILTLMKTWPREFSSLQESETFQLVSNQNKIKNLTIKTYYKLHMIKILINLCRELEYISFGTSVQSLEPTIRYLLSKRNESTCHLSSLYIFGVNAMWIEKLQTLIESTELLDDYLIKVVNDKFYLKL
ncbi:unnamed protein product, partial [Rotaria sp. Silwood2]